MRVTIKQSIGTSARSFAPGEEVESPREISDAMAASWVSAGLAEEVKAGPTPSETADAPTPGENAGAPAPAESVTAPAAPETAATDAPKRKRGRPRKGASA